MTDKLSPSEKVQLIQQIYTLLRMLTDEAALAGVILTHSSYEEVKNILGPAGIPYNPSGLELDPQMENSFISNGVLILRGTQLQ